MKIYLYSGLRKIAGRSMIDYSVEGSHSLLDVLNFLAHEFPAFKSVFFDPQGKLYDQMPIFLNGRNPRLLQDGLHSRLDQEDSLSLFTPIASGKINVEMLHRVEAVDIIQESGHEH